MRTRLRIHPPWLAQAALAPAGKRLSKALKKEDQIYGQMNTETAKKHSSEMFNALDDPLEMEVFSMQAAITKLVMVK